MATDPLSVQAAATAHRGRALPIAAAGVVALWVGLAYAPAAFMAGDRRPGIGGVVLVAAGVAAIVAALRLALRGCKRWARIAVPVVSAFVLLEWVVLPAVTTGLAVHAPHARVPSVRTLGLPGGRDVWFIARDGVTLGGWYVPSRNGAAVVVLHGSHGDRTDTTAYDRMLARAGFGVLAFDARGHGESSGRTNALGWQGAEDVAGAVAYLRRQGVDPARIGALGLSMGAEEALRAAAEGVPLHAIVADGAGASTFSDARLVSRGVLGPVAESTSWLAMRGVALLSGEPEPQALRQIVGRISVPTLLIASNRHDERAIDAAYRERIPGAALWYLPDAGHTRGLATHPRAYERRVLDFLSAL